VCVSLCVRAVWFRVISPLTIPSCSGVMMRTAVSNLHSCELGDASCWEFLSGYR
jgi:hypothetical protein